MVGAQIYVSNAGNMQKQNKSTLYMWKMLLSISGRMYLQIAVPQCEFKGHWVQFSTVFMLRFLIAATNLPPNVVCKCLNIDFHPYLLGFS